MKTKASVVVLLCVIGLAAIFSGNVEAAPAYYTCTISQVGSNYLCDYVTLTDTGGAFSNTTFILYTVHDKEMLAVFLAAAANSNNVSVYLADTATYSSVLGVALVK